MSPGGNDEFGTDSGTTPYSGRSPVNGGCWNMRASLSLVLDDDLRLKFLSSSLLSSRVSLCLTRERPSGVCVFGNVALLGNEL